MEEDAKSWLIKMLLPSMVALSIKLAIQSKTMKMSLFNILTSFVTGVGPAYLLSDVVFSSISPQYTSAAFAVIAISGEKIGYWFVYKFNVENILESLLEKIKNKK
jgi:hypothetical protein